VSWADAFYWALSGVDEAAGEIARAAEITFGTTKVGHRVLAARAQKAKAKSSPLKAKGAAPEETKRRKANPQWLAENMC
jgi:hypothetical protein